MTQSLLIRRLFSYFNRFFMVPMFRLGLGPYIGNPFSGYVMVLKTIGRKTGKVRYAPVNYTIQNGSIYCLSGFGQVSHWYRNLRAQPQVEIILPGGTIIGEVEEVTDAEESLRAMRQILRSAGFAGFFEGFNPFTVSDEVLRAKLGGLPVIRIRPTGVGSGPSDGGGWLWLLGLGLTVVALLRWGRQRPAAHECRDS
jgi:deazaflavin-dependent oxidoreductase (nitroreductase family)